MPRHGGSVRALLVLAAMEPFFAAAVSIPLGIWTDKFGGRTVFTLLLLSLTIILFSGPFAEGYYSFLLLGSLLGLGGAAFVVGNAHVSSWYPESKQGTALGIFAVGNIGKTVGMMAVTLLVTRVLNGPERCALVFATLVGWQLAGRPVRCPENPGPAVRHYGRSGRGHGHADFTERRAVRHLWAFAAGRRRRGSGHQADPGLLPARRRGQRACQGRRRGLRLRHDDHSGRQQGSSGRLHLRFCPVGADERRRVLHRAFARRLQA